jgi:hypothetical protein
VVFFLQVFQINPVCISHPLHTLWSVYPILLNFVTINLFLDFEIVTVVALKSYIFWDIMPCIIWRESTDILEEHITSIFRVKKQAQQESTMKEAAGRTACCFLALLTF